MARVVIKIITKYREVFSLVVLAFTKELYSSKVL
jgi:hypothetical protein